MASPDLLHSPFQGKFSVVLLDTVTTYNSYPFTCSDVASPSTTPCGICRQFIREFCADTTPVYMVSSTFPSDKLCSEDEVLAGIEDTKHVRKVLFGDLLPMSFGPENLGNGSI